MPSEPQQTCLASISELLGKEKLANLPTPVCAMSFRIPAGMRQLTVKLDNLTGELYGGNKVRKLEYLLHRARLKECKRIATFGTVASHHALATALYAKQLRFPCTCFLSHQAPSPAVTETLKMHLQIGTSLVRFGGAYEKRVRILRQHLWGRHSWVVPAGGTSWLGAFGFVCAGVELAQQIENGLLETPDRLYVAAGTMGTAAGLALGLALGGLKTEVHAIRVSATFICNDDALWRVLDKTARMMHRLDRTIPRNLATRCKIVLRHEFFAGGYARTDNETEAAIRFAAQELDLQLEGTYTGKAMAAVIRDLSRSGASARQFLFWNTYNSAPLPLDKNAELDTRALPEEFLRYAE